MGWDEGDYVDVQSDAQKGPLGGEFDGGIVGELDGGIVGSFGLYTITFNACKTGKNRSCISFVTCSGLSFT